MNRFDPLEYRRQIAAPWLHESDATLLEILSQFPTFPPETDPAWDDDELWERLMQFDVLADVVAERKLLAAIPLLLDRACYGDPGEVMRSLRHRLEAIVQPDWRHLADACMAMLQSPHPGARLWATHQLGVLRDPRTRQALIDRLADPAELVRQQAAQSLYMLCQRDSESHVPAMQALQKYLHRSPHHDDQRAALGALADIQKLQLKPNCSFI
jgi:HEAT repeat protein